MPSINRIRVNNVKYNFGTQYYDDFTMRMYGKNTLYDLANGGGKSVLMLLLLQNMIPNSTLDEKQPIEKLFRTGNGNTTIHSLVEWKLDPQDVTEGYRYMTTGFCARKAETQESFEAKKDVASIEYFNYCIFYREFNKNDIINLPLVKNGEHVGYQTLRNYLKDLPHKDMSLKVQIFDRKGEYQRFISDYGIHESQWEIIRGINKTEGHVRTYFENNYKTTRKVVEDLLIEEIIEKAYNVKTEAEGGSDSMARTLMEIKEQLAELARKKKDISAYDHQTELISVLRERVTSFTELYREHGELARILADICVTGEAYAKQDESELSALAAKRDEKNAQLETAKYDMTCLRVNRDKQKLSVLLAEAERMEKEQRESELAVTKLTQEIRMRESANDYLDYLEEKKRYDAEDAVIKKLLSASEFDEKSLYLYASNLKRLIDAELAEIVAREKTLGEELSRAQEEQGYREKLSSETRMALAAAESAREAAMKAQEELSKQLSEIRMGMNNLVLVAQENETEQARERMEAEREQAEKLRLAVQEDEARLREARSTYDANEAALAGAEEALSALAEKQKASEETKKRLSGLLTVYGAADAASLTKLLTQKITEAMLTLADDEKKKEALRKKAERVRAGRLVDPSESVAKVREYLERRHGAQVIYGADYIAALPKEQREELLSKNPELPYGLIIENIEALAEDRDLVFMEGLDMPVVLYDKSKLSENETYFGEGTIRVHAEKEVFTEEDHAERLIASLEAELKETEERIRSRREILSTYRDDFAFAATLADGSLEQQEEEAERLSRARTEARDMQEKLRQSVKLAENDLREHEETLSQTEALIRQLSEDYAKLDLISRLSALHSVQEETEKAKTKDIKRLRDELAGLEKNTDEGRVGVYDIRQSIDELVKERNALLSEWEQYAAYYNPDGESEELSLSKEELAARFESMLLAGRDVTATVEDKRALMRVMQSAMDRILKNIEKRDIDPAVFAERYAAGELHASDAEVMRQLERSVEDAKNDQKRVSRRLSEKRSESDQLSGSISYQTAQIEKQYGSLKEQKLTMSELEASLADGEALLTRLAAEAKEAAQTYTEAVRTKGSMVELYKDAKRIVQAHEIDLSSAVPMHEEKDSLRTLFEEKLLAFDRNEKQMARAKNELLKAKGNTAQTLDQLGVFELANSIREDLSIPDSYEDAKALIDSLVSMEDFIRLEKERVEKSLTDMKNIKESFEEQCLQRCLDVRTELDKLPKLSRIVMDGETIQMVGLTIPYVKEDFMRQRMSDYIDGIVSHIDTLSEDRDRMKYIRNSLTLKKMFGVIVTDMNQIKLSLYKRERIREQSRYLKYEEAVGSTGQSQGIYIQFLVSVINYISGMYGAVEDEPRTKTVFIDNPFGAAKDIYIWEPIFALLAANHVQLIVPARGATPAITGRFDVNYILGQQMSGGKQLTVVTDYTSTVDQTELEYSELDYEQVSFDFI